jgi:hypothetical protein
MGGVMLVISTSEPSSVAALSPTDRSDDITVPAKTWYLRMSAILSLSVWTFAKAASVGAKTVNGPGPERTLTRFTSLSNIKSVDTSDLLCTNLSRLSL